MSLKGLGRNNVGPASQTVAQHCFTIGPMYRVIQVVAFGIMRHPYVSESEETQDNHPVLFQYWASVEFDCPALHQQWAVTVAQHWTGTGWIGLHCVYQVHRIDAYIDLLAMVVEGISHMLKIYLSPWFFP